MADDIATMSYEAALAELDGIIARLERGDVELEAAIAAYERGAALSKHCTELLNRTEQKITQLVVGAAGEVERPFQPQREREPATGNGPAASSPSPALPQGAPLARARSAEQRLFGGDDRPAPAGRGAPVDPDDIPF